MHSQLSRKNRCLKFGISFLLLVNYMCGASIDPDKDKFEHEMVNISYPFVLGAQKNRLIETVLLSTHSICLG